MKVPIFKNKNKDTFIYGRKYVEALHGMIQSGKDSVVIDGQTVRKDGTGISENGDIIVYVRVEV